MSLRLFKFLNHLSWINRVHCFFEGIFVGFDRDRVSQVLLDPLEGDRPRSHLLTSEEMDALKDARKLKDGSFKDVKASRFDWQALGVQRRREETEVSVLIAALAFSIRADEKVLADKDKLIQNELNLLLRLHKELPHHATVDHSK